MPHQLGALRDAGGAQGVALGNESSRGIDDVLSAVGDIAVADELVGLTLLGQAEGVNSDHLVSGEAVVELDDLDVSGGAASLAKRDLRSSLGHIVAHQVDGALVEQAGGVGGECLAGDEDSLGAEVGAGVEELLRDEDGGCASIGGGAALQLGERAEDGGGVEDLLARVHLLELGVRVALAVLVVDASDLGEVVVGRAVLLHVLDACVAEHLGRAGGVGDAAGLGHHHGTGAGGVLAVVPEALEGAGVHLLEADDEDAVRAAVGDDVAADVQAGGAGGAVVVDVVDGDLGHAELVEDALAAGGVAVAVAGDTLVNIVVADMGVEHGLDTGLETELGVVNLSARLDELGHANAEDVASLAGGGADHGCGLGVMRIERGVCGIIFWSGLKENSYLGLVYNGMIKNDEQRPLCFINTISLRQSDITHGLSVTWGLHFAGNLGKLPRLGLTAFVHSNRDRRVYFSSLASHAFLFVLGGTTSSRCQIMLDK
jgi:hypothetical protein